MGMPQPGAETPQPDTAETVQISSFCLLKMLRHGEQATQHESGSFSWGLCVRAGLSRGLALGASGFNSVFIRVVVLAAARICLW
jgi:hypothetical protein